MKLYDLKEGMEIRLDGQLDKGELVGVSEV